MKIIKYINPNKKYTHYRIGIEDIQSKFLAYIFIWLYYLYYTFGRTTYIRVIPTISTYNNFRTVSHLIRGFTRFTVKNKSFGTFKYIKPKIISYEEVCGLGLASISKTKKTKCV